MADTITDVFGIIKILDHPILDSEECIVTVASPGFSKLLITLLSSLKENGGCDGVPVLVYAINPDESLLETIHSLGALAIKCETEVTLGPWCKALMYSTSHLFNCDRILCLDSDMLILDNISELFQMVKTKPGVYICPETVALKPDITLKELYYQGYGGNPDIYRLLNLTPEEECKITINSGLICTTKKCLNDIFDEMRKRGELVAKMFIDSCAIADQYILNLACIKADYLHILPRIYNHINASFNINDAFGFRENTKINLHTPIGKIKVLHFAGGGKIPLSIVGSVFSHPEIIAPRSSNPEALMEIFKLIYAGGGDKAFEWTFYGISTPHGTDGWVNDPDEFSVLMFYYSLLRSQGVQKVFESGTGNGLSTLIAAAAVHGSPNAQVVTVDFTNAKFKEAIWALMPEKWRILINHIDGEALDTMKKIQSGYFDAALLDSNHSADHVYKEFKLASQIVKSNGLIIIHDPFLSGQDTMKATEKIRSDGYPLFYHMHPEIGFPRDNHLGLAIIQNIKM